MKITNLVQKKGSDLNAEDSSIFGLQKEMNRLFDDFFGTRPLASPFFRSLAPEGFLPKLDVAETEKEYTVTADLPGVEESDVDIALAGNVLTIKGEKKSEKEEKEKNYHRVERSYGSFQRSISLPQEVDTNNASAEFKNGVLKIRLPKTEEAKKAVKKISVKSS